MVSDERPVIAGSFNYTAPATTLNDENIVVLGDLEETDPAGQAGSVRAAPGPPGLAVTPSQRSFCGRCCRFQIWRRAVC